MQAVNKTGRENHLEKTDFFFPEGNIKKENKIQAQTNGKTRKVKTQFYSETFVCGD